MVHKLTSQGTHWYPPTTSSNSDQWAEDSLPGVVHIMEAHLLSGQSVSANWHKSANSFGSVEKWQNRRSQVKWPPMKLGQKCSLKCKHVLIQNMCFWRFQTVHHIPKDLLSMLTQSFIPCQVSSHEDLRLYEQFDILPYSPSSPLKSASPFD